MLEIPVKLIVKAPNQQIEDQTIQCCLTWTIKRLKGYLSEVYPSKPNTEDQRLIYYGQLLNDSVTLKDVFKRYEAGEETHTVHLVCMPSKESLKMQARKMAKENTKKIRETPSTSHRLPGNEEDNFHGENQNAGHSAVRPSNYFHLSNYHYNYNYQNWINSINSQHSVAANQYMQQWAWMQQIYGPYYLSQYMEMVARQYGFREEYDGQRPTEDQPHNPQPQPPRNVEDEDNRRDWLDYFCLLSRLIVLLAILYFYSSPARFLIVSSLGMALYLYQVGFFRMNHLQGAQNNNAFVNNINNNNINNNNNNNAEPNINMVGRDRAEDGNLDGQNAGNGGQNLPSPDPSPRDNLDHPDHPSFVAVTWTFVTTFFSSIIPDAHNAL